MFWVLGASVGGGFPGGEISPRQFMGTYSSSGLVAFVPLDGLALWPLLAGFGEAAS